MHVLTNEAVLASIGLGIIFAQAFYITYMTGQLSFGHAAFASIGAYTGGMLSVRLGLPVPLAILAATVMGFISGVAVAIPALRTRHVNLAIMTFGVMQIVAYGFSQWDFVGGLSGLGGMGGIEMPDIALAALIVTVAAWWLERSRLGLAMRTVKQDELVASMMGISTVALRLLSFGIGAAAAGCGGALSAHYNSFVDPNTFGLSVAVNMVFYTIAGGTQVWLGPVIGAALLTLIPEYLRQLMNNVDLWRPALFAAMIVAILAVRPEGLVRRRSVLACGRAIGRLLRRPGTNIDAGTSITQETGVAAGGGGSIVRGTEVASGRTSIAHGAEVVSGEPVHIEGLSMRFGGVQALADLSLDIPRGAIIGLIGPNGAGKTTLFNLLTGAYRPTEGSITIGNTRIDGLSPSSIARCGVSRTFQNIRLLRDMTVLENVLVGQYRAASTGLANVTRRSRATDRVLRHRAHALLEMLGLWDLRHRFATELPYATQRRVEIARAIALNPALLLLDEPTAGMDHGETAEIADVIRLVHRQFRPTILLIEHDMSVVMGLCTQVAVLNFGRKLAEGTPAQIQGDKLVQEAYLGPDGAA